MANWPNKDPDDELDYVVDWSQWLGEDTIVSAAWSISPSGALALERQSETDDKATVWLSGGEVGSTYEVTCQITTAAGRTRSQTTKIKIKEL